MGGSAGTWSPAISRAARAAWALPQAREHDARYDAGEDFLEAAYKLWEGSWEDGAALRDRASGLFTQPGRVHRVTHDGPSYRVDGQHLSEPSPQRTPVLYQAGASSRGRLFAARHAESIFLNGQTKAIAGKAVRATRQAAKEAGRDPYDIRMFLGATVIVAPTRAEAFDLRDEYARYLDVEGQLALVSGWTGIDLSELDAHEGLAYVKTNAMQSLLENLTLPGERPFTRADFAEFGPRGARAPFIVGSPSDVADALLSWADEADIDGFNLTRAVAPETIEAFVDLVVPALQDRGAFKTRYREGTLREKLFPEGGATLKATHPGARFRRPGRGPRLRRLTATLFPSPITGFHDAPAPYPPQPPRLRGRLIALATGPASAEKPLRIGATPGPVGQTLAFAADLARKQGQNVEIVEFTDWVTPNEAVASGDIDANLFQHVPYLQNAIRARGYKLVAVEGAMVLPVGLFSKTVTSLDTVPDGSSVAIANDPVNAARGLRLLETAS